MRMSEIRWGNRYRVSEGAGIDSGREGVATPFHSMSSAQQAQATQYHYTPFEHKYEIALRDDNDDFFTMFVRFLEEIHVQAQA